MIFSALPLTAFGATADNSTAAVGCDPIWFEIDALLDEAYILIDDPAYTLESRMTLKEVVEYTEEIFIYSDESDLYALQEAIDNLVLVTEPETTLPFIEPTEPDPTEPETTIPEPDDTNPDLPPVLYGDADLNDKVNIKDATYIQKYLVGLKRISVHYLPIYDVDQSGDVDIRDATTIQKYVANLLEGTIINKYYKLPSTRPTDNIETTYTEEPTEPTTHDDYHYEDMECDCWKYTGMLSAIATASEYLDNSYMYSPESIKALEEIVEYAKTVYDFDEAYEVTSLIEQAINNLEPAPTDNVYFVLNVDCSGRIEGYNDSSENKLLLVNCTEELEEVLAGITPYTKTGRDDADLTDIRSSYNEEFFKEKSLLISLCCIGGTGCYQFFDCIKRKDNTLTLYSFVSAPEFIPPDMNYQIGVLEIPKAAATGVTELVYIIER